MEVILNSNQLKNKIVDIAQDYSLDNFKKRILSYKKEDIDIKVALLGEFSSGKTTLANALLGTQLLPTFKQPTTAIITEIALGPKDKYTVIKNNGNKEEIEIHQLADAVTNVEENKKLIIQLSNVKFLNKNINLIDTPGVNSINETHEDITYGYLPLVDEAFILIDINFGGISKSFLNFLNKYPKEMLTKIHYVFNFADTKTKEKINSIINKFKNNLKDIDENPDILVISAKEAQKARKIENKEQYKKSGVKKIENMIKNDTIKFKKQVQEKRLKKQLIKELKNLKKLLQDKIKSLTWDTPVLNKKIKKLSNEIKSIKKDIKHVESSFKKIKEQIKKQIRFKVNETIDLVANENENIEENLQIMQNNIENILESGVDKIQNIKISYLDDKNISYLLQQSIKNNIKKVKDVANFISKVATFALTVWLVPGATTALEAGELATATIATASSESENVKDDKSTLNKIGLFINQINPIEHIKKFVVPLVIDKKKNKIFNKISNNLDLIFQEIETQILEYIKDKKKNVDDKKEIYNKTRKEIELNEKKKDKLYKKIQSDINLINTLLEKN